MTGVMDWMVPKPLRSGTRRHGVVPATLSIVTNVFTDRKERARAIAIWAASAGMA